MGLEKAKLINVSKAGSLKPNDATGNNVISVMFNPDTYTITTKMLYPDISIPGLQNQLVQFVRGDSRVLSVTLFLDQSDINEDINGSKEDRDSPLQKLRTFIRIDSELHAPPVCMFAWGKTQFVGVVTDCVETFKMFGPGGEVLRATVNLSMKEYAPPVQQAQSMNRQSPDRTKTRAIRTGDRLDLIAAEEYGDPSYWTTLAEANNMDRPRLLAPGTLLVVPSL